MYLSVYPGSSLVFMGFLQLERAGSYSLVVVCRLLIVVASHCCRAQAVGSAGSIVVVHGFKLPCDMWNLPGSGIKPVLPALAGGSNHTPPGQPPHNYLFALFVFITLDQLSIMLSYFFMHFKYIYTIYPWTHLLICH